MLRNMRRIRSAVRCFGNELFKTPRILFDLDDALIRSREMNNPKDICSILVPHIHPEIVSELIRSNRIKNDKYDNDVRVSSVILLYAIIVTVCLWL